MNRYDVTRFGEKTIVLWDSQAIFTIGIDFRLIFYYDQTFNINGCVNVVLCGTACSSIQTIILANKSSLGQNGSAISSDQHNITYSVEYKACCYECLIIENSGMAY